MAAQISRFSTRPQRKMIKSFSEQIGGSACPTDGVLWNCPRGRCDLASTLPGTC